MGGGGGGVQAPTLNASDISKAQTTANVNAGVSSARLNNVNQVTPFGNLNYNETGGQYDFNGNWIPQFTATSTLSPEQQGLLGQSTTQKSNLFNLAQGAVPSVLAGLSTNLPQFGALPDATQYKTDAYNALMSRGNLALGQQTQAQQALNANQGVAAGSEAYNRSLQPINQQRVDLSNQSTINAQQLANQLQTNEIAGRQWATQNALTNQQAPLQNYASLIQMANGGQPTNPTWVNSTPSQIQAADITSPQMAAFNAQNQQYLQSQQAQAAQSQGLMSGLFGLGGSALGAAGTIFGPGLGAVAL